MDQWDEANARHAHRMRELETKVQPNGPGPARLIEVWAGGIHQGSATRAMSLRHACDILANENWHFAKHYDRNALTLQGEPITEGP